MDKTNDLETRFGAMFGASPRIYRAPGRVNLIGEHTDYNDGFVMPAAIAFSCWVAISPRNDRKMVIHSENFGESVEANLDQRLPRSQDKWHNYPLGVVWALQQDGHRVDGANLYIRGDVPLGAGLSSSAAIEVAVGYALLDISGQKIDRTRLALLCQRAENEFVGARCGIMDQFISCYGRTRHGLMLDCRSLDYRLIPIPSGINLVICNTMVKHEIGGGEYNIRRAQCEEGVRKLADDLPNIRALRDVTLPQLEQHRGRLTDTVYKRCRHVISENDRVRNASLAFQSGRNDEFGQLMAESHRSLRDDYEVSCSELDLMVELAWKQHGVLGARMTGGGFGGCTINLVNAADSLEFQRRVAAAYHSETGLHPDIYICEASEGAGAEVQADGSSRSKGVSGTT